MKQLLRFVVSLAFLWLSQTTVLAQSGAVSCTCYCGKVLRPPCSDSACKTACGWREPTPGGDPNAAPSPAPPTSEELDRQARTREVERQRKEKERKHREDALKAAEEAAKQADFLKKRDEAVTELKGIDSTKFALKEVSDSAPKPCAPSTSAMVVDLCDPGTDLPKGVSDAIEGVLKNSPRAVTDRVRKGFNAVMNRDWNLAKVWFKDALHRDPTNEKLRALVTLVEYEKAKPQVGKESTLRIPTDDDLKLLFPGDSYVTTPLGTRRPREFMVDSGGKAVAVPADYHGAIQTYVRLKDRPDLVPVPSADDLNLLFPGAFVPAPRSKVPIYRLDVSGKLIELPLDYSGSERVYIKGKTGRPVQVPVDADLRLVFPAPSATPRAKMRQ